MEFLQYKEATHERALQHPAFQKVLTFLKEHDLTQDEPGNHPVAEDFFYNVIEMTTTSEEERVWESHRDFYDVHIILSGRERIQFNFLSKMAIGDYDAQSDWQQMEGQPLFDLILEEGSILLLDPNDAHRTGLVASESGPIRKVVFKVKIE